jgi:hypothetical protein
MTPIAALLTVAAAADADRGDANERLLWAGLALVVALLAGAAVLAAVDRWRRRMTGEAATGADALAGFRLSYERGELSEEEYRRVRARLAGGPPERRPPPDPPANAAAE